MESVVRHLLFRGVACGSESYEVDIQGHDRGASAGRLTPKVIQVHADGRKHEVTYWGLDKLPSTPERERLTATRLEIAKAATKASRVRLPEDQFHGRALAERRRASFSDEPLLLIAV